MTKPKPRHEVTLRKHSRGPILDALFQPICADCGPLDDALDLDAARAKKARHAGAVAAVTGADHGGAS